MSLSARRAGRLGPLVAASLLMLATPFAVHAHEGHDTPEVSGPPPLDAGTALTAWTFDPLVLAGLLAALVGYLAAVRSVDRAHPSNGVPRARVLAWVAGLGVILLALQSPLDTYATTLFSVHMVQHLLLALVAAPLLALGAPITLLLRAASATTRRRYLLPVLHSRLVRLLAFPVVAWILFTGVMWVSHFSPLFDAALEQPLVHQFEHVLFLGSAMLFWWPVVAVDPVAWRMSHPARLAYVFLQMPQNSFLGLALISAQTPLYAHYATLVRGWGPSPLEDQQVAAAIMWAAGDLLFVLALVLLAVSWLRAEDAKAARADARADARLDRVGPEAPRSAAG